MTVEGTIDLFAYYEDEVEAERLFIDALVELQRHYKLYVSGCGCCESPFLTSCSPSENKRLYRWGKYLTGD